MKDIEQQELYDRFRATFGALAHLRMSEFDTRRRFHFEPDIHDIGNPFIRDCSALGSSKASRRAGKKNQVASSVYYTHVRDRSTHSDEVEAHACRICDHLGLNVYLGQGIAKGHDLGHVPMGHQGEHYIQKRLGCPFTHEVIGVIVSQHVERKGAGMNLTWHTLDGMHRHSGNNMIDRMTQEARVVNYSDKFAYIFADYNDFKRFSWLCPEELVELMNWFGDSQRSRTFRAMLALCEESAQEGKVSFEKTEPAIKFKQLKKLMYREYSKIVEQDVARYLDPIWDFLERSELIPPWLGIALLTDVEVRKLSIENRTLLNSKCIMDTGLGEILNLIPREKLFAIDPCNLDLDW